MKELMNVEEGSFKKEKELIEGISLAIHKIISQTPEQEKEKIGLNGENCTTIITIEKEEKIVIKAGPKIRKDNWLYILVTLNDKIIIYTENFYNKCKSLENKINIESAIRIIKEEAKKGHK